MSRVSELELLLQLKRHQMTPKMRARTANPKLPAYIYPIAIERQYASEVSELMKKFVSVALNRMEPRLKSWLKRQDTRQDTYAEDIERFMQEMEEELLALYGVSFLFGSPTFELLERISKRLFAQNMEQWAKQTEAVLGMAWPSSTRWWPDVQRAWEVNNHALMKAQARDFLDKTVLLVMAAMQKNSSYSSLVDQILALSGRYTGTRANLLARDQVGNLNATLWQEQYTEAGLPFYTWQTAMDERVRGTPGGKYPKAVPSHYVMQGLLMRWDDMSVYSPDKGATWIPKGGIMEPLHVGMAPGCRCTPLPYWVDVIARVDSNIAGWV